MFKDVRILTNPGPTPLHVWFEPWGMSHMLQPGESFRVVGQSSKAGHLEIVQSDGSLAVYAWAASTLQVFNGSELVDDYNIVVPELPQDMSTRSFIEFMFGGPGERTP